MTFFVFLCYHCGKWSVKEVRKETAVFKCKYCGKSTKIKQKKIYGLALRWVKCDSAKQAQLICAKLNEKKKGGNL